MKRRNSMFATTDIGLAILALLGLLLFVPGNALIEHQWATSIRTSFGKSMHAVGIVITLAGLLIVSMVWLARSGKIAREAPYLFLKLLSPQQFQFLSLLPTIMLLLGIASAAIAYKEDDALTAWPLFVLGAVLFRALLRDFEESGAGRRLGEKLPRDVKPRPVRAARIAALIPLGIAVLIACDLVLAPAHEDVAQITHLRDGVVHAEGRYSYVEEVSQDFLDVAEVGDTLHLDLTRFFYEWDHAELQRDGKILATTRSDDLSAMGLFLVFFASAGAVFLPRRFVSKYWIGMLAWLAFNGVASGIILVTEILMWVGLVDPPPGG